VPPEAAIQAEAAPSTRSLADEAIAAAAREAAGLAATPPADTWERYSRAVAPHPVDTAAESPDVAPPAPPVPAQAPRPALSPFLADHTVSIVLYLGAFLVITAAAIFLAYSWGDIQGTTKLGLLMAATAGFLGVAALCLRYPSVQLAGHTFLAIGAILVPANFAAAYVLVFADGPIPAAVFWLVGALLSGGLHGLLSYRLSSRAYGVLATLSVPVAASALAWLIEPEVAWFGPASALALIATLAATRWKPGSALAESAQIVAVGLMPLTPLVPLPFENSQVPPTGALPAALILASAGLAWEATHRDRSWWIGAAAILVYLPFVGVVLAGSVLDGIGGRPYLVSAIVVTCWIALVTARRISPRRAPIWDLAAIVPALVYPFAAFGDDRSSAMLFGNAVALATVQAYLRRSTLPLYASVLAADALYIKLLDIFGSPDSPAWSLGVALWPLGLVWGGLALGVPRRIAAPFGTGALLTLVGAALLTANQPTWNAGITLSAATVTVALAWRLRLGVLLLTAVPWLLAGLYQAGVALQIEQPYRLAAMGLGGWLLFAVSLRSPRAETAPVPVDEPAVAERPDAAESVANVDEIAAADERQAGPGGEAPAADDPGTLPASNPLNADWAPCARLAAFAVTGFAAILVLTSFAVADDRWLRATMLAWIDLGLLLGAWARAIRSRDLGVVAALSLVPAILAAIGQLHPSDPQAFVLPVSLYLIGVATVVRRDPRPSRTGVADAIAGVGLFMMLMTGIVQTVAARSYGPAVWTLVEGFILVLAGIVVRWPVLLFGGLAGIGIGAVTISSLFSGDDAYLVATLLAWLELAAALGIWARSARSRDIGTLAALAVVPALIAGVARLHVTDPQGYAVPVGLYLLGVAWVARRDRRQDREIVASALAALGMAVLTGAGVAQTLRDGQYSHLFWTLGEGLALVVAGIVLSWRELRFGGAASILVGALVMSGLLDTHDDGWLVATAIAWADLALALGIMAWASRSRDLGIVAALVLVPAMLAGIARLHPGDAQAYAIPLGLYLLALAFVIRRDRRGHHPLVANVVAAVGMLVLLGTGIVQALDRNDFVYTLWTLAEGLILTIAGIALRWRALVVGGVAGVVVIALRQLFDAVSALPGWAILGGSGLLLLGLAVLLLVARARLTAAGRAAAERWSTWD